MPAARARRTADVEVPVRPRPRSDVYVGLLLVALLAQLAGVLFLFLDYSAFPEKAPPKAMDRPPPLAAPGGAAPGPGAPAGGAQGVQPGGAAQGVPPGGGAQGVPPGRGGAPPAGGNPAGMRGGQP
jgi:hypothetical protein